VKQSTHALLGMGVAGYVARSLGCGLDCWLLAVASGLLANIIVDVFGHEKKLWRPPRRTRLTHSLPGVILASLAPAALIIVALRPGDPQAIAAASIAAGLSHWLADLITPAGVYLLHRRIRAPIARYDNPWANALLTLLGVLLLAASIPTGAQVPYP